MGIILPAMVVKWEGENPADTTEWIDVLHEALDEDVRSYWIRFYRQPGGWRFDLEYREAAGSGETTFRQADESIALHVYRLLVESRKPLDPGWKPFESSPAAPVVLLQAPLFPPAVAEAAPASQGETAPPAPEAHPPTSRRRGRRRHRKDHASPEPVREAKTKSGTVEATLAAPDLEPLPKPQPPPASRPPMWPRLRPALIYVPAVLLVAFAGWLARGRVQPRPVSRPAPSPSAPASQEPSAAEKRLKELEAVVAQLQQERAQALPGRRPGAPVPIGGSQQASRRLPAAPEAQPSGEIAAPTSVPGLTPTTETTAPAAPAPATGPPPAEVSSTQISSPTDTVPPATPFSTAAPDEPPPPPPVQRGVLVELSDPDVAPPVALTQTRPRYPPLALERRLSGTVWLNALVDETGAVIDVTLVRAAPRGLDFEDAATRYVRSRTYRPATKGGVPVRVWLPIVVEFRQPGR